MAQWEDNMRGAVTPEGIMTTTGGAVGEGGSWSDNWRNAWTPEGLKIVGDGGGGGGGGDTNGLKVTTIVTSETELEITPENNTTYKVLMLDGGEIIIKQPSSPVGFFSVEPIAEISGFGFNFGTLITGYATSFKRLDVVYIENVDPMYIQYITGSGSATLPVTGYVISDYTTTGNNVDVLATSPFN